VKKREERDDERKPNQSLLTLSSQRENRERKVAVDRSIELSKFVADRLVQTQTLSFNTSSPLFCVSISTVCVAHKKTHCL